MTYDTKSPDALRAYASGFADAARMVDKYVAEIYNEDVRRVFTGGELHDRAERLNITLTKALNKHLSDACAAEDAAGVRREMRHAKTHYLTKPQPETTS